MSAEPTGKTRRHVYVNGLVQGVGFRWYCQRSADNRSLAGWVRNLPDGRVELEVEGPTPEVETFLADIRRGPPGARITDLQVGDLEPQEETGFMIRFDL